MKTGDRKSSERGELNVLLIPLIVTAFLFFVVLGFGYWAFTGRQDYKNNLTQKVSAAVVTANQQLSATKDAQFAQEEKNPLKTYLGPEAFGTINLQYPKTWSGYVVERDSDSTPINGYFSPGIVTDVTNQNNAFALRIEVVQQSYSSVLQNYDSRVQQKLVSVTPFTMPQVPKVIGVRLDGAIQEQKQGSMVILPLRNQTLEVWTEAPQYKDDFNNIILKNFTFVP